MPLWFLWTVFTEKISFSSQLLAVRCVCIVESAGHDGVAVFAPPGSRKREEKTRTRAK